MNLIPVPDSKFKKIPDVLKYKCMQSGMVPVADPMLPLWELPAGTHTVILIGGRGGCKTYGASQFIANQSAANKKRSVILRDEKVTTKNSILAEIQLRYQDIPFRTNTYMTTTGMREVDSPNDLVFMMGFRASDNKKKANMKGVSDIDYAVVEEAEDITDDIKFNTFVDGLRKEGCIVVVILNTPDIGHFILKRYFNTNINAIPEDRHKTSDIEKEYDGYFQVTAKDPKERPGVVCIQTDYEDNEYLPERIKSSYLAYGDPASSTFNLHYYLTAIKGYASTGRKGQVLRKVKPISLKDYMALPFKEYYGQDFGTSAPAGMVGVKLDKNNCWCREINYKPMSTLQIGKLYCDLKLTPQDRIIVDHADQEWKKLRRGFPVHELSAEDIKRYPQLISGFNVIPCVKDGVKAGIDLLESMNLFAVEDKPPGEEENNLWKEIRMRIYAQDKNGNYTNEPEPGYDHLQDPWIYVVNDQRGKKRFQISTE